MNGFPTRAPVELEERPREQQWLVDTLWTEQAVGIVGGEPKCGKSILALDLAVAVAAGVPCLRHFTPTRPGPVLMFPAEDAGHLVRKRLHGIAKAAGARFEALDIAVIDVPRLRLDHLDDRRRLQETVERIAPRLVILDPLVRLHGVDENAVADVAPILGFLREIQRRFGTAVLLVHHARKSGATRPGQALRGSSELHAWGDSNLYLRRRDRQTLLTVEQRDARDLEDIEIELMEEDGEEPSFRLRQPPPAGGAPQPETPERRILKALSEAEAPLSQRQIRERAATRHKTVGAILRKLVQEGRIERNTEGGYSIHDRALVLPGAGGGAGPGQGAAPQATDRRRPRAGHVGGADRGAARAIPCASVVVGAAALRQSSDACEEEPWARPDAVVRDADACDAGSGPGAQASAEVVRG